MRAFSVFLLVLTLGLLLALPVSGFNFLSSRWPTASTSMYVAIGEPWDSAFAAAMGFWSQGTVFQFTRISEYADPCADQNTPPLRNGLKFSDTVCGDAFGENVLAVARTWSFSATGGGVGTTVMSGIVFNNKWTWNVYDGPWSTGANVGVRDFRRVAVHELGHVMGLDHEDDEPTIMATSVSTGGTIVSPQADDIAGINSRYGGADTTGPALTISSHTNNQVVTSSSITLSGTATDSSRGDNGVSSVTVNDVRASGDTATGTATASWSRSLSLGQGANIITVVAKDASSSQNATTQSITVTYTPPGSTGTSPTLSTYHVFPQYADGRFADGRYFKSTLMISNPGSSNVNCTFRLYGLTVDGQSVFTYTVSPTFWQIASSSAVQSLKSGYATLQCTASVEAQLLYSFYAASGSKLSEATVFSSPPASLVQILGDGRESARIGLAIANDSDQSASYTLSAYSNTGQSVGSASLTLSPRTSRAAYLDEFFTVPSGTYGQIFVSAGGGATASLIGLRFTGDVFTTIPSTNRSTIAATAKTYHVFPQFADGVSGDGTYFRSTLMIANPSSSVGTTCTFRLYGLTVNGQSTWNYTFSSSGWTISLIGSSQTLKSGYGTLECAERVDSQLLYSFYSAGGGKISEATVFSSPSAAVTQVLADSREGARLGLAVANDTANTAVYSISVYNSSGALINTVPMSLAAKTNRAAYINDLMSIPANHYGPVVVTAPNATGSIIGLRFTGNVFTTIPETIR